jgi:hypothetical protein
MSQLQHVRLRLELVSSFKSHSLQFQTKVMLQGTVPKLKQLKAMIVIFDQIRIRLGLEGSCSQAFGSQLQN